MNAFPVEVDFDTVLLVDDIDLPERFVDEVANAKVAVDYEAECWELTGSCLQYLARRHSCEKQLAIP